MHGCLLPKNAALLIVQWRAEEWLFGRAASHAPDFFTLCGAAKTGQLLLGCLAALLIKSISEAMVLEPGVDALLPCRSAGYLQLISLSSTCHQCQ